MTRTRLANNMLVPTTPSAAGPTITSAISMEDNNALNLQVTVLSGGGASANLVANIWGSDDMENWLSTGLSATTIAMSAAQVGAVFAGQITTFGYAYARISFTWTSGGVATLIAIDANTYKN